MFYSLYMALGDRDEDETRKLFVDMGFRYPSFFTLVYLYFNWSHFSVVGAFGSKMQLQIYKSVLGKGY